MAKQETFRGGYFIKRDEKHQNIQVLGGKEPLSYEDLSELGSQLGLANFKSKEAAVFEADTNKRAYYHYTLSLGERSPWWENSPVHFNKN